MKKLIKKGNFQIHLYSGKSIFIPTAQIARFKRRAIKEDVKSIGWSNGYDGYGDPTPNKVQREVVMNSAIRFSDNFCDRGF